MTHAPRQKGRFLTTQLLLASLFFVLGSVLNSVVAALITASIYGPPEAGEQQAFIFQHPWPGLAIGLGVQALIGYASFLLLVRWREKRAPTELQGPRALPEFLSGAALGVAYIGAVMAVLGLLGAYRIEGTSLTTGIVVGLMIGFGAAFAEEVFFRGFVLRLLDARFGTPIALTVVALIFGLIHLANGFASGESSLWGALAIMLEAGLLLNAAYYLTRRLWFVIGLHLAWNFMLGGVFGLPVSGIETGGGLLRGTISGPTWLTGGTFGPEGSVVAVVLGLVLGVALLIAAKRRGHLNLTRAQPNDV